MSDTPQTPGEGVLEEFERAINIVNFPDPEDRERVDDMRAELARKRPPSVCRSRSQADICRQVAAELAHVIETYEADAIDAPSESTELLIALTRKTIARLNESADDYDRRRKRLRSA